MSSGRTVAGGVTGYYRNSLSRRDFLRLGGVGLAGVALLGASACGGPAATNEVVLSYMGDLLTSAQTSKPRSLAA
jgi:hypothetical protein